MLEKQRWGLVSQKACEGPSKTHLAWVLGEDQWRSSKSGPHQAV
jgi:hypothetical protein